MHEEFLVDRHVLRIASLRLVILLAHSAIHNLVFKEREWIPLLLGDAFECLSELFDWFLGEHRQFDFPAHLTRTDGLCVQVEAGHVVGRVLVQLEVSASIFLQKKNEWIHSKYLESTPAMKGTGEWRT